MKRFIAFYHQYTSITVFLLILGPFIPSCTVNKTKTSTVDQAAAYKNWRIKIKTINGNIVKLRWIEDKHENIVSIKNTHRVMIENSNVRQIKAGQHIISLDSARNHSGKVQITTINRNFTFLRIQVLDDHLIGIETTGREIIPVVIPKNQIEEIKVKNKGLSIAATIGLALVVFYVIALVL